MILEIKPYDTLFFRDGKPFNKGDESWADAIFPPYPATIYGALRSAFFNENINIFEELKKEKKLNTETDPTTKLKINNIIIKKSNDSLFSLPKNILHNNDEIHVLTNLQNSILTSVEPLQVFENNLDPKFKFQEGWLDELIFKNYLSKKYDALELKKKDVLFKTEPKVGIALNSVTGTSDESALYRVDMLRLNDDVQLVVDFEGLEFSETIFKLGGEGKYAMAKIVENIPQIPIPKIENKFLIYFATPVIFKQGWLPGWIDKDDFSGIVPNTNLKVKLKTVANGKPNFIGGFDLAEKSPKPMFRAVPAGSVYFFEIVAGDAGELKKIHTSSISEVYPEQGFGICYVGIY